MSGITSACAGAKPPPVPLPPFNVSMNWTGAVPVDVTSASGSTSGSNRFVHSVFGAVGSVSDSISVTSNTSGKLGLTTVGTGLGVSWSGLAVGEGVGITVSYTASDSAGRGGNAADSAFIRRIS